MGQQKLKELPAKLIPERGHQDGLVMFSTLGSRYDPLELKHHGAIITCLAEQKTIHVCWAQKNFPKGGTLGFM